MNKYSINNDLLGFSIHFLFKGMEENNKQFNNFQLFESENKIHVKHRIETLVEGGKCYSIRVFSDLSNYTEVLDLVYAEIKSKFNTLTNLGLVEGISFGFFIEHYGDIQWTLKNEKLKKLNDLTNCFPGISLDSIDKSWNDKKDAHVQVIFHQLFFSLINPELDKYFIEKKWKDEFFNKYKNLTNWNIVVDNEKQLKELSLSIKEDINQFNWDEQFADLLNFISKYSTTFLNKSISITYGFYQQNRSDMQGGEIGYEIVRELSKLGIDLRFTLSSKPPETENKY
jgi:hypothetical protein